MARGRTGCKYSGLVLLGILVGWGGSALFSRLQRKVPDVVSQAMEKLGGLGGEARFEADVGPFWVISVKGLPIDDGEGFIVATKNRRWADVVVTVRDGRIHSFGVVADVHPWVGMTMVDKDGDEDPDWFALSAKSAAKEGCLESYFDGDCDGIVDEFRLIGVTYTRAPNGRLVGRDQPTPYPGEFAPPAMPGRRGGIYWGTGLRRRAITTRPDK